MFLDHAPVLGGAERSLLAILDGLDRDRWDLHFGGTAGSLMNEVRARNVKSHQIPMPRLRRSAFFFRDWLSGARTIVRLQERNDIQLVYANTVRAALYASLAARLSSRPFLWHMRDFWLAETLPNLHWADQLGKQFIGDPAVKVIANSQATARQLPGKLDVSVVHNGIDPAQFDPSLPAGPFRHEYGIPENAIVLGTVGRLRPWKGQDRFLRAMHPVVAHDPEVHLLIVGGSPFAVQDDYPDRLYSLAVELGIADRVTFTGHLLDVRGALAAMDIFIHPGDPEPFGLVNIEAMAMERPVVAFAHGALPEIVRPGETGLLVPPTDGVALTNAVFSLLQNPGQRIKMGPAGRVRVENHFTVQQMVQGVSQILESVPIEQGV